MASFSYKPVYAGMRSNGIGLHRIDTVGAVWRQRANRPVGPALRSLD